MAHSQKLFKFLPILVATSTLALAACTKKNEAGTVSITMPATIAATSGKADVTAQSEGNNWNTSLNPTVGSDINCYAVFVGGAGLDTSTCQISDAGTTSTIKFGPFVGLLASGTTTTLEVPPGSDRVFHVVGFRASSLAKCSSTVLPGNLDDASFSEPFMIASKLAAVPAGPSDLSIQPVLNLQKKVVDCKLKGSTDSTGGGSSTLMFGDSRDGKLRLQGTAANTLTVGTSGFQSSTDVVYTPNSSGNIPGSKLFGASRQIINIDNSTSTILTTGAPFTNDEFQAGDEILFYVSAGNSLSAPDDPSVGACGSNLYRGRYETRRIVSASGSTIKLDSAMVNAPALVKNANLLAPTNTTNFCRISIHRIPSFEEIKVISGANFALKAAPYNPESGTGGVVVLRTQKLQVDGTFEITSSALGYTGGIGAYGGSSVGGFGGYQSISANDSGGGATASGPGASGGGAGPGGSFVSLPMGGLPINYCENPIFTSVASGAGYSCATAAGGETSCWGSGVNNGNLGEGVLATRYSPVRISNTYKFGVIAAGNSHTCGIEKGSQSLYCWGNNSQGQLGDGTIVSKYSPNPVNAGTAYRSVAVGGNSTCAVTATGQLQCWGFGASGQIGDNTTLSKSVPTNINSGSAYTSVSVGLAHACGVRTDTSLWCWGTNSYGQLGDGTTSTTLVPKQIIPAGVVTVSAGTGYTTCALDNAGFIKCWGKNSNGQLGDGTQTDHSSPALISGAVKYTDLSVGSLHACAVSMTGVTYCWGQNSSYQIGNGSSADAAIATPIDISMTYSKVSAGANHTCGLTTTGLVKCWGDNSAGQLGSGSVSTQSTPGLLRQQQTCLPLTNYKAFFGGGGGGSSTANGAAGGGLVLVFAKELVGTGTLRFTANGADGNPTGYASGAGGGGTVGLTAQKVTLSSPTFLTATGGNGAYGAGQNSGGGGGGTVEMKHCAANATGLAYLSPQVGGGNGQTNAWPGALGVSKVIDSTDICTAN